MQLLTDQWAKQGIIPFSLWKNLTYIVYSEDQILASKIAAGKWVVRYISRLAQDEKNQTWKKIYGLCKRDALNPDNWREEDGVYIHLVDFWQKSIDVLGSESSAIEFWNA